MRFPSVDLVSANVCKSYRILGECNSNLFRIFLPTAIHGCPTFLANDVVHHAGSGNASQFVFATAGILGELLPVEPQQVQNRGVQIVWTNCVLDGEAGRIATVGDELLCEVHSRSIW